MRGAANARPARRLAAALAFLALGALPATAQTFPALTGRVVDGANLLSPAQESALTRTLAAFEQRSSDQVVVATVPSLQGTAVEDYANRLARTWALGRKGEDNGVLFLVARDDRKLRIEVGYGLEGTLTDALSSTILSGIVTPAFRAGDFASGIEKGTDAILQVLSGDAAELQARAERNAGWQGEGSDGPVSWIFVGLWLLVILVMMINALRNRGRGRRLSRGSVWGTGIGAGMGSGMGRGGWGGGFGGGPGGGGFSGGGGSFGGGGSSGSW